MRERTSGASGLSNRKKGLTPCFVAAVVLALSCVGLIVPAASAVAQSAPRGTGGTIDNYDSADSVVCSSVVSGTPASYTKVHVVVHATNATPGTDFVYYLQDDFTNHTVLAVTKTAQSDGTIDIDEDVDTYNGAQLHANTNYGDGFGPTPVSDPPLYYIASEVHVTGDCDTPPVNNPPVAFNDNASTVENTSATVDVLANDTDLDKDVLHVATYDSQSVHGGTVSQVNNGTELQYTPTTGYTGTDTFTYTAGDGKDGSNTATVTITVTKFVPPPQPRNPVASAKPGGCVTPGTTNGIVLLSVTNPADGTHGSSKYAYTIKSGSKTARSGSFGNSPVADGHSSHVTARGLRAGSYTAFVKGSDGTATSVRFTLKSCPKKIVKVTVSVSSASCGAKSYRVHGQLGRLKLVITVNGRRVSSHRFYVQAGQHWRVKATVKNKVRYMLPNHKATKVFKGVNRVQAYYSYHC